MNTNSQPKIVTPTLEVPNKEIRLRTGLRAGDGGVTHTDNWRDINRR